MSVLAFVLGQRAHAQGTHSRFEIGAQASFLSATLPATGDPFVIGGFGGRFTWNLSRRFALDSELDWFPRNQKAALQAGGDVIAIQAGPKITLYRGEGFGFFAKIRPGLLSSDNVCLEKVVPPNIFECSYGRVTHFAVDMGGVVELYPTRHLTLRVDLGETLIRMYDREATLSVSPTLKITALSPGGIRPGIQIEAGLSYRLGSVPEKHERQPSFERFSIGAQFVALSHGSAGTLTTGAGFGGTFAFDLRPHLAFDSALLYYPSPERGVTPESGGRLFEGLFGAKIGLQRDRLGYFLTLRPGFLRFSKTVTQYPASPTGVFQFAPNTWGAFNVGPSIEVYTSRRTTLRFDVGDTMLFVPAKSVPQPPLPTFNFNSDFRHSIQVSAGFGFRF